MNEIKGFSEEKFNTNIMIFCVINFQYILFIVFLLIFNYIKY